MLAVKMRAARRSFFTLLVAVLSCGAIAMAALSAGAQSPPADKPAVMPPKVDATASRACGPDGAHATVGQGGNVVVRKPNDETMSSKLAGTGGVICPPGQVDPEIRAPTPEAGRTPVIPPGAVDGNQPVQPK